MPSPRPCRCFAVLAVSSLLLVAGTAVAQDAPTFADWKRQLGDEQDEKRREAVRELAVLAVEGGPDAKSALRLVLRGLQDDSLSVRAETARVLSLGMEPEQAAEALSKALKDVRKEIAAYRKDAGKGTLGLSTVMRDGVLRPAGRAGQLLEYAEQVIKSLGKLRFDRSRDALVRFLKNARDDLSGDLELRAIRALLAFGDRESVSAVIEELERLDRTLPPESATAPDRSRGVRVDSSMRGDALYRLQFPPPTRATLTEIDAALRAFAQQRELPGEPERADAKAWSEWLEQIADALPEGQGSR